MLAMFLDESGDHSLDVVDPQYPLFVLGGCIIDMDYHESILTPGLRKYKMDLFGRDDFVLHTADIVRRRGIFRKQDWSVIEKKFRRNTQGRYMGFGLVILPKDKQK